MPVGNDTIAPFIKSELLSVRKMEGLRKAATRQVLQPGQFQSGAINVQRPVQSGGTSESLEYGVVSSGTGATWDDDDEIYQAVEVHVWLLKAPAWSPKQWEAKSIVSHVGTQWFALQATSQEPGPMSPTWDERRGARKLDKSGPTKKFVWELKDTPKQGEFIKFRNGELDISDCKVLGGWTSPT